MTKQNERICYECKHMVYEIGEPDWSEITPGYPPTLQCACGHWDALWSRDGGPNLKVTLQTARTCPDYDPDPELVAIGREP